MIWDFFPKSCKFLYNVYKKYINIKFIMAIKGMPILKLQCLVLCLNMYIPAKTPKAPDKKADKKIVFSFIRHFDFSALDLSIFIIIKVIIFHNTITKTTAHFQ